MTMATKYTNQSQQVLGATFIPSVSICPEQKSVNIFFNFKKFKDKDHNKWDHKILFLKHSV